MSDNNKALRTIDSIICQFEYNLDEDQQAMVRANFVGMSMLDLAKMVYGKKNLNERSEEVRNIKKFVIRHTRIDKGKGNEYVNLTEEQRKFVRDNADKEKPIEIARRVFKKNDLAPLSKEVQTIDKYIKCLGIGRDFVGEKEERYKVPKNIASLIPKVNTAKGDNTLTEDKLDGKAKKSLEDLKSYLNGPRFLATINSMSSLEDKELFEYEFINGVFEKELNSEEVNMYISLCSEYVLSRQIKKQLDMLNAELESDIEDEDRSIKMALTEAFGKKSQENDACLKRIKSLQESLSGSRSKRLDDQVRLNASLVNFIELWKNEEERNRMIIIAKASKERVKNEMIKIENESEYVAKVLGISFEEVLNG